MYQIGHLTSNIGEKSILVWFKQVQISQKILLTVTIILVISVGSLSYVLFQYAEKSTVSSLVNEMGYLISLKRSEIDSLHSRATEDILFAVNNQVFVNYFELPESKSLRYDSNGVLQFTERQRELKIELEQWIRDFQTRFTVEETCIIDDKGQEHVRLVLGDVVPDQELSSDQSRTPFFGPTLELRKDQVHIQEPYVSPDTRSWVIAYSTPIVLPDGNKPAIFHFEMPTTIFQDVISVERGRMYVVSPEGYLVADSATDFHNRQIFTEKPEDYFPALTAVSNTEEFSSMLEFARTTLDSESNTATYIDDKGETHYVVYRSLPGLGWLLIYDISYWELLAGDSTLGDLRTITFITASGIGVITLLLAFLVSGRIVAGIKEIADLCKYQKPEKLDIIKMKPDDELVHVVDAINTMVSKIKDNESRITEANKELIRLDKMKTEFLSLASHELRTPIQPIMAFADLGKKGKIKPETAFEEIKKQSLRLAKLASDILDVSRIEGGRLNLVKEKVNINEWISDLVNTFRITLSNDIAVELRISTSDDFSILVDRARLNQVLANILDNSAKFTRHGNIVVETRAVDRGKRAEITISDNGPGIHQDILPRLFEKFITRNGPNSGNKGGTGLGLYLCKAIIDAHGGSISASNNDGAKGAKFKIILPA